MDLYSIYIEMSKTNFKINLALLVCGSISFLATAFVPISILMGWDKGTTEIAVFFACTAAAFLGLCIYLLCAVIKHGKVVFAKKT